jgi:predicted N-acetyltransferase YhbS
MITNMENFMIQKGKIPQNEYVDLINYTFGMNGSDSSFYKLLPKLFGEKRDPSSVTFFGLEGGKPVAAVGAFPLPFQILDNPLQVGGIGNVAVHPGYRGKGYMKACMKAALDWMIKEGYDLAVLSGRRHRYAYFGFEKCANEFQMEITQKTVAYVLGKDYQPSLRLHRVERGDEKILDQIAALHEKRVYRCLRPRKDLYDILISWQAVPYAFLQEGQVVGYVVLGEHGVLEFTTDHLASVSDMVYLLSRLRWEICWHLPSYEVEMASALLPFAETCLIGADICFRVFHWEKILSLLFLLKTSYTSLLDGDFVVEIQNFTAGAASERLELSVQGGKACVQATQKQPEIVLSHQQAMSVFFLPFSPERQKLSPILQSWLPLPISILESDNV